MTSRKTLQVDGDVLRFAENDKNYIIGFVAGDALQSRRTAS